MITIVDYGMGNLGSIVNMLRFLGVKSLVTSDPAEVSKADKLILPGVGAFDKAVENIKQKDLWNVLNDKVIGSGIPTLGICLGMQLLAKASEEGQLPGLGWIDAQVVRFKFGGDSGLKVPHIGWNNVRKVQSVPLFEALDDDMRFYFVHSYHLVCNDPGLVTGETTYGYNFCAMLHSRNISGVQFHPEKSHKFGMQILRNFSHA